ncbi:MAG: UvrD-helicase domain-containing protein [Bacteroidales bacterium]|nr:UvrD-helicase domain-containing protein [Bacteroidales bacterium]
MITVYKASAGSGKTYTLSREYIRMLLSGDITSYRHILAVTFTNKATAEMKRRILKELYKLSTDTAKSDYFNEFVPGMFPDADSLGKAAKERLNAILHDYSAFSVSTIDRFFQQALKAFAREIGQVTAYQVELDRDSIVEEAVGRILDSITEDESVLRRWLKEGAMDKVSQGKAASLEYSLTEMAKRIKSPSHDKAVRDGKIDEDKVYSRENLDKIRKGCTALMKAYASKVSVAASAVNDTLNTLGIQPGDFNRGFMKYVISYLSPDFREIKPPSDFVRVCLQDSSKWFSKAKDNLRLRTEGVLDGPAEAFAALFGEPYREYNTARILLKQLFSLGIAREISEVCAELQKEKGILLIDDSNQLLKKIIDGSDAPFVYEKLGVRFEHFLLDEFQDTSDVQWDNLEPLLQNSEANNNDNLIVGDVKQSIYRWRGSDWKLLGSAIDNTFRSIKNQPLDCNYRTLPGIVNFNNKFFDFAAKALDTELGTDKVFESLYSDVAQVPKTKLEGYGYIEAVFIDKETDPVDEILSSIDSVLALGGHYRDIAILVRNNADGSQTATSLLDKNIPVISDDSLHVKSSVTVRRLVSQLSMVVNPPGKMEGRKQSAEGFLAREMGISPETPYLSLTDLAESLLREIRKYDEETFDAEIPYINAFMDYLKDRVGTLGSDISSLLKDWEGADPVIASPSDVDAVRIITIHKAKGLEFNYVIFPFAEKVTLYHTGSHWCSPALKDTKLSGFAEGAYDVTLSAESENTLFRDSYHSELILQGIDNLNLFYVAMTRPCCALKVIAAAPAKEQIKSMSDVLYQYLKDKLTGGRYVEGELSAKYFVYDEKTSETMPALFPSYSPEERTRLRVSAEASDFFGDDGSVGIDASRRILGNVMHRILSGIIVPEDLPREVSRAVSRGELSFENKERVTALLEEKLRFAVAQGWFSPDVTVLNESSFIDGNGNYFRPDRIEIRRDADGARVAEIIDFKFGEPKEGYKRQVRRYASLLSETGYKVRRASLWYVQDDEVDDLF